MDNGKAFNHWCKRWNRTPVEQAGHDCYMKRNPDTGPSLATRKETNRRNQQREDDAKRKELHASAGFQAGRVWTVDEKAKKRRLKLWLKGMLKVGGFRRLRKKATKGE